jgi:hypothetical protein
MLSTGRASKGEVAPAVRCGGLLLRLHVELLELVPLVLGALGAGPELVPLARERRETGFVFGLDLACSRLCGDHVRA